VPIPNKLSLEDAKLHLESWTLGTPLRRHARAVELSMRQLAKEFSPEDETVFAITGLMHDADYEQWPDEHPHKIVAWLHENHEPAIADAVAAHYTKWGVPADSGLAKALLAADEATGFVCACCYVRPRGIASLEIKSILKKLKDKKFAAKVDRREIQTGCDLLGISTEQLFQWIVQALKDHAEELGIQGT